MKVGIIVCTLLLSIVGLIISIILISGKHRHRRSSFELVCKKIDNYTVCTRLYFYFNDTNVVSMSEDVLLFLRCFDGPCHSKFNRGKLWGCDKFMSVHNFMSMCFRDNRFLVGKIGDTIVNSEFFSKLKKLLAL